MKIHPKSKLLFIGDSITDCGRWGSKNSLGDGYVNLVNNSLESRYPHLGISIVNKGISGDTIRDLKKRWQRDVLDLKPDWLSIMIGINDVWQYVDNWIPQNRKISIEEYEHTLDALITEIAPSLKGLILLSPYYLETNRSDPMRAMMDRFGAVVCLYAKKYDAIFVDMQAVFDDALQNMKATDLSEDRIHMNIAGHGILADAFVKAIE